MKVKIRRIKDLLCSSGKRGGDGSYCLLRSQKGLIFSSSMEVYCEKTIYVNDEPNEDGFYESRVGYYFDKDWFEKEEENDKKGSAS